MRLYSSYVKCKFGHVRFDLILIVYDVISCKNIKGLTTDTGGGDKIKMKTLYYMHRNTACYILDRLAVT